VDLVSRLDAPGRDSAQAVFLLPEYEIAPSVSPAAYKEYVDGYVMPQMTEWIAIGLITSAAMYAARVREGAPFHALLILEHENDAAYARRDAAKDEARKKLAAIPAWKAFHEGKAAIRTEKFASLAREVPLV